MIHRPLLGYLLLLGSPLVLVRAQDSSTVAPNPTGPTINTPTGVTQCLPTLLQVSGGSPPYYVAALPGGDTGAPPIVDLGTPDFKNGGYTWFVNVPAGTTISLRVKDGTGATNYAKEVTVQSSSNSTCLKGGTSAGSTSPNTTPVTPTTPTTGSTTTSGSPPATTSSSAATPAANNSTTPTKGSSPFTNTTASTNAKSGVASTNLVINRITLISGLAAVAISIALFA